MRSFYNLLFIIIISLMLPVVVLGQAVDSTKDSLDINLVIPERIFSYGEDIPFTVIVENMGHDDVIIEFSSTLQIDYTIDSVLDNGYRYSSNNAFAGVITAVTIPAHGRYAWDMVHTTEACSLPPSDYELTVELVGTSLKVCGWFTVRGEPLILPDGIELSITIPDRIYQPDESIPFSVTAKNISDDDIALRINARYPLHFRIVMQLSDSTVYAFSDIIFSSIMEYIDIIIEAGESMTWDHQTPEHFFLYGGDYYLYAGLNGFTNESAAIFTVSSDIIEGTVTGTVYTYDPTNDSKVVVSEAILELVMGTDIVSRYADSTNGTLTGMYYWSATSGSDGSYTINDVPLGRYFSLHVRKEGFDEYIRHFQARKPVTTIDVGLKMKINRDEQEMNISVMNTEGIEIMVGTNRSLYEPGYTFRGVVWITNHRNEPLTIELVDGYPVYFALCDDRENEIWNNTINNSDSTIIYNCAQSYFIDPGDTREYVCFSRIYDMTGGEKGKYSFTATVVCADSTVDGQQPLKLVHNVTFAVVEGKSTRIETATDTDTCTIDAMNELKTTIDIALNDSVIGYLTEGEIIITETRDDYFGFPDNYRFIKVIAIDADQDIRGIMTGALLRFYVEDDEYTDLNRLVIAHKRNIENSGSDWELLETRVDIRGGYAEAWVSCFSLFALLEMESTISVDTYGPDLFNLSQNSPNPFNPMTAISFSLPENGHTVLTVYNLVGQEISQLIDSDMSAGPHHVVFNGTHYSSGIYFYRLTWNNTTITRRMLLIK